VRYQTAPRPDEGQVGIEDLNKILKTSIKIKAENNRKIIVDRRHKEE
jgi:hypothetical protein